MTWTRETTDTPETFRQALTKLIESGYHGGAVVLLDHGSRNVDELNAGIIDLAWSVGFRGNDAQDTRDIRRLMTVARGDARPEFFHSEADEQVISEHLTWVADDAESWLSDAAPDGCWIGNDGERGAFGCWPIEDD